MCIHTHTHSEILVIHFPHNENRDCSCTVDSLTAHPLDTAASPRKVYNSQCEASLQFYMTLLGAVTKCNELDTVFVTLDDS